jgi:hypothetical protein
LVMKLLSCFEGACRCGCAEGSAGFSFGSATLLFWGNDMKAQTKTRLGGVDLMSVVPLSGSSFLDEALQAKPRNLFM